MFTGRIENKKEWMMEWNKEGEITRKERNVNFSLLLTWPCVDPDLIWYRFCCCVMLQSPKKNK